MTHFLQENWFVVASLIKIALVFAVFMTTLAYLQWIERKVLAHIQSRVGPLRVGPHGLFQPLADVFKLLTKEDLLPSHVNRLFFLLGPFLAVALALIPISVVPFGPHINIHGYETDLQISDLNIGVMFILAATSLGVYGIALGAWASNNKYSLMGSLRSAAQMVSYELPMALAIAAPLLLANSLSLRDIVDNQGGYLLGFIPRWHVFQFPFPQIFGFILFLISSFAETNRIPFDLPEAENELVGGYHTEYSSMKFACFFMSEYANMVTATCFATLLFLGGWQPLFPAPYSNWVPVAIFILLALLSLNFAQNPLRKWDRYSFPVIAVLMLVLAGIFAIPALQPYITPIFWFASKVFGLLFLFIWVRGTLPRFRYDQLMRFAWTFLFPIAMLNMLLTALAVAFFPGKGR
jgi:NADH-quinone oxidoreductase subunit H